MTKRREFSLKELKSDLEDIQSSLEKAETKFNNDKDLLDSIGKAKEAAADLSKNLKGTQENS